MANDDVDGTKAGRASDFTASVLALYPILRAHARRLTRDRAAADDLVQATMERALGQPDSFRPGSNLRAWLTCVMINLFRDLCRRQSIERRALLTPPLSMMATGADERPTSSYLDLYTMADLMSALDVLDAENRNIFVLAHLKHLSYKAIGARLNIKVSTVGTRLLRARTRVRQRMEAARALPHPPAAPAASAAAAAPAAAALGLMPPMPAAPLFRPATALALAPVGPPAL
jgi:RNA polymerase sigma-70 factor (ECF subfamily)